MDKKIIILKIKAKNANFFRAIVAPERVSNLLIACF